MLRNMLTTLLAVAAVALAVLYSQERMKNVARMKVETDASQAVMDRSDNSDKALAEKQAQIENLQREIAKLRRQLTEAMQKPAVAAKTPVAAKRPTLNSDAQQAIQDLVQGSLTNMAPMIAQALTNAFRSFPLSLGAGRDVASLYGPLMAKLGLSGERRQAFIEKINQRMSTIRLGTDGASEIAEDDGLRQLLGADGYRQWQDYEATVPGRIGVTEFDQRLAAQNLNLSESQRENMVNLFNRYGVGDSGVQTMEINLSDGNSVDQQVNAAVDRPLTNWNALVNDAGSVLNGGQMTALDSYLGERLAQREETARTAAQAASSMVFRTSSDAGGNMPAVSNASIHVFTMRSGSTLVSNATISAGSEL